MSRLLPLLLSLLSTVPVMAAESPVLAFSRGLQGLDGRFEQTVFDAQGQPRERSEGSIALALPRLFRWEYEQPFPQLIVADGDHVWIFDPDLEQVTVRKQSLEEQSSPLSVLIDPEELDRQFRREDTGRADGLDWVRLTPRAEDATFAECRLGFDGVDLARMVLVDTLGQRTEVAFSGWRRNPTFELGHFRFDPPPGVDVIGERIDAAEVYPVRD